MGLTNEHVGTKILAEIKIYILNGALFAMRYPVNRADKIVIKVQLDYLSLRFVHFLIQIR